MDRLIQREALLNHPFFGRIYDDIQRIGHDFNGKVWSIEEFLYNINDLLRSFLLSSLTDKMDFYDSYTYNKFKSRSEGHQYTIEFLISWIRYYQDHLEIRMLHQLCMLDNPVDALKFMMKARKAACKINDIPPSNAMSQSADEIFIDKPGVVKWCDELFGVGSDSAKVWKWLQQEYKHLRHLSNTNPDLDGIKLLSGHITPDSISLSFLLEYVLKDFLPDKKRYINRLYEYSKQMDDKLGETKSGLPTADNENTEGGSSFPEKNLDYFNYNSANPKIDAIMLYPNLQFDYDSPKKHNHRGSYASNCKKCNHEHKYLSTPNLNSQSPADGKEEVFGIRFKRRKLLRDISKMTKDLMHRKMALSKALALCRSLEPQNIECKRRILFIQRNLAMILNDKNCVPQQEKNKLLESVGMDSFEPYDNNFVQQKLFKDFLNKIQDKGVKLGKEFRDVGMPCANKLDELVQEIEGVVRPDPYIFRKKREDSPWKGPNRGSPDKGGIYPYYGRDNGLDNEHPFGDFNDYNSKPFTGTDSYNSPKRNEKRSRDRSVTPEMQQMDDDFLADSLGAYEYDEDPNNDFIAALGDRKELTQDAANYDTNELGNFLSNPNDGNAPEDKSGDDYVIRMQKLTQDPQRQEDEVQDQPPIQHQQNHSQENEVGDNQPDQGDSESEATEVEDIDPEIIIPDPILKYVEVEVKAPPKETAEINLSTTDLYIEPEPYEPPVVPPKPDMEHKVVDAVPPKPETITQEIETDKPELVNRSMECEEPELIDKDFNTDAIELGNLQVQTDQVKIETKDMNCETDKPAYKTEGFIVKTDPIQPKPRMDHFMKTDDEKLAERAQLFMTTIPITKPAKSSNMTMVTDVIKKKEKKDLTVATDPPVIIAKKDLIMIYEKPITPKKDFECGANPDFIQDLLNKAKEEEVKKERERVERQNELKKLEAAKGKKEFVQSGQETDHVPTNDKNMTTDDENVTKVQDFQIQTEPKESADQCCGREPTTHQAIATDTKEYKHQYIEIDTEFEQAAIRDKLPKDSPAKDLEKSNISKDPKEPDSAVSTQKKPSDKNPRKLPTFEDKGWKRGNTGGDADVSGFDDKEKKEAEKIKPGKLDGDDYAFLKKKEDIPLPKRKTGKKVVRESPFKKSQSNVKDSGSPVSKSSGFKRQLTTGTRNS